MARSVSARALAGVAILVTVTACGSPATGATSTSGAASPPAAAVAPPATTTPVPAASPTAPARSTTYDTAVLGSAFDLPMTVELPAPWMALTPPQYGPTGSFGWVHTGSPPEDDSQWWGAGLMLVDGASMADPADMDTPASPADTRLPWPASYLDYLAALPGVEVVEGPSPVTIGGVEGRQIVVKTPAMHPTIFLKGDRLWMGGGGSGIDPAFQRELTELTVGGKAVIIEYVDSPQVFEEHRRLIDEVIESITFPTAGS
jgi:hypothetical protein